jgi:diguanylate cyclase (GGDEF)-like protein
MRTFQETACSGAPAAPVFFRHRPPRGIPAADRSRYAAGSLPLADRVNQLRETFDDLRRSLRERPDELMLEVGAGGEELFARMRVLVALLLALLPLINYGTGGNTYESAVGLSGALLLLSLSLVWLRLAQLPRRRRWLPFASSIADVSLVSLVLWLLCLERPAAGLNSIVVFVCYPLAIFATALRNDPRVTVWAGATAIAQFALLGLLFGGDGAGSVSADYGSVDLSNQLQRLLLLLVTTLIVAAAVQRMQRVVQLSGMDVLTGLPNRSYLRQRVPQLLRIARDENRTLCLAIIDLDAFRRVNDDFGHVVGDRALRHCVGVLRDGVGRDEPLIRIGGEEFVLVMHQPVGRAWERLEALRLRLATERFEVEPGGEVVPFTLSAGIASAPQDDTDLYGLMKTADQRLRQAKQQGRNRVVARG